MNWLGKLIQKHVDETDTVLDLGCGIMPATTATNVIGKRGVLKCKLIIGVELVTKYLDEIKDKYSTIKSDVRDTHLFVDDSYDVVICTDVLEHLKIEEATVLLKEMKRIARKKVIIYTPLLMESNEDNVRDGWGMGENKLQQHQCVIPKSMLHDLDYKTTLTDIDGNIFGVYTKKEIYQSELMQKSVIEKLFGRRFRLIRFIRLYRRIAGKYDKKANNPRSLNYSHQLWDDIGKKPLEETMEGICDGWDKKTFNDSKELLMFEADIQFKKTDKVLDLACGIGRACKWIAPNIELYTGIDFSEAMIKKAKDYNNKFSNTVFTTNNGLDINNDDSYFDTVFCELAYQHMIKETQIKNTSEVLRVLKDGGKYYVQLPKLDFFKDKTYCWEESELEEHFKLFSSWKLLDTSHKFRGYFTVEAIK